MPSRPLPGRRVAATLAIILSLAGCSTSSGAVAGYTSAPPGFDVASPRIEAADIAFTRAEVAVPAYRDFVLVVENRDTVPHNVSIYADTELRDRRFEGRIFEGPATRWYPIKALAPGSYVFLCDLHPTMRGTLIAS